MEKQQEVSPITLSYINMIVASMLMLEYTDQLRGTDVFRHGIKYHASSLEKELEKLVNADTAKLYQQNETTMVNLNRNMQTMIHRLASLRPDEMVLASQLLDEFFKDREGFAQRNPVMFHHLSDG